MTLKCSGKWGKVFRCQCLEFMDVSIQTEIYKRKPFHQNANSIPCVYPMKSIYLCCMRLLLCLFILQTFLSFGQSDSSSIFREKQIIALPVVFRFPETRWGAGVAGTATFSFRRDSVGSNPSQLSFGVTFTQNRQLLVFLPFTLFLNNNLWYIFNDSGWYRYNYFFYGIGENRGPQEVFDVDFPRIRLTGARAIAPKTYLGLRVQYEAYRVTGVEPGGLLASGDIPGSTFSRTSGVGPYVLRDRRDQVFYPTTGSWLEAFWVPSSPRFGANVSFSRLHLDYAVYRSLHPKVVSATNLWFQGHFGPEVPFNQLAFLGGQRKMRGLYEGYFRDRHALLWQQELRWMFWQPFGLVGFGSMGFLGDAEGFRWNKPKFSYGLGLRIATKSKLNLRLDYGMSPYEKGTFYATIGEAF